MFDFFEFVEEGCLLRCDEGEATLTITDPLNFHRELAGKVGEVLTLDSAIARTNIIALVPSAHLMHNLSVDYVDDDTMEIEIFLGDGVETEQQLSDLLTRYWFDVSRVLNILDPGSWGYQYLYSMRGMTEPAYDIADCPNCGDPIDYCLGHGYIEDWE